MRLKNSSRKIKMICTMLVSFSLVFSTSSCELASTSTYTESKGGENSQLNVEEVKTKDVKKMPEQFTMMTWLNEATVEAVKVINQKFSEAYQDSKVNLLVTPSSQYADTLKLKVSAGEVDLFSTQAIPSKNTEKSNDISKSQNAYIVDWIEDGVIENLTDKSFVKNYIESSTRDASMYNGKVYSVNTGVVVFNTVFYNKKIFKDNALSEPETWNEFMEICRTLKSKGISPITVAGKEGWPVDVSAQGIVAAFEPDMKAFSKDMYMGVRSFNDAKNMRIWKALWEWVSYFEPDFKTIGYDSVVQRFVSGKAAMFTDGSWQAANIQKADSDFKFGTFIFPGEKAGEAKLCGKYDLAWMVMQNSRNKYIALKWLEFFSRSDNYTYFINQVGWIPTQPPQAKIENEVIKKLLPLARDFQLAQEVVWHEREGVGDLAYFQVGNFKELGGQFDSYQKNAEAAQKDWEKGSVIDPKKDR